MLGQQPLGLLPVGLGDENSAGFLIGNAVISISATGELSTYIQTVALEGNVLIDVVASGTLATRYQYAPLAANALNLIQDCYVRKFSLQPIDV